jgi:hypothetical protein
VPPELVKGNQPPPEQAIQAEATAAVATPGQPSDAAAEPAPAAQDGPTALAPEQPKSKPKAKKKVVRAPPPPDGSVWDQTPAPTRIDIRRQSPAPSAPPAEPQPAQAAQPAQSNSSVWPDPPPVSKPAPNVWPAPPPPSQFPR